MRTEVHEFTREEIEQILKNIAQAHLVGRIYYGNIVEQTVEPRGDGGFRVFTRHEPSER